MWNVSHHKIIGPWGLVYWSSLIFETKETKGYSNTTASYSLQRYFWPQKKWGKTGVFKEVRQGFAKVRPEIQTAIPPWQYCKNCTNTFERYCKCLNKASSYRDLLQDWVTGTSPLSIQMKTLSCYRDSVVCYMLTKLNKKSLQDLPLQFNSIYICGTSCKDPVLTQLFDKNG